jgi:ubiquinone/menaquinone biosynthesis C-methylase UbiE
VESVKGYVLGHSTSAARRLEIQDAHFADISEKLLDGLVIRPTDRVVELGCGPGGLSRRIMRRLGEGGVLVGVDRTEGLLNQARELLAGQGKAQFVPTLADISQPGAWLDGADVVVGRAVLHHVPMAEILLGKLKLALKPGTRVGFMEPDFCSLLGRLTALEAKQPELEPLRVWAIAINQLYHANRISPAVGATLGRTLQLAGYQNVQENWQEFPTDGAVIENMLMFYDEVRDTLHNAGILTAAEVDRQQSLLRAFRPGAPAVWGMFRVTCVA